MSFFSSIFGGSSSSGQVAPWAPVDDTQAFADAMAWKQAGKPEEKRDWFTIAPTGSMRPNFDAGDFVGVVAPCPLAELQVGAVVIVYEPTRGTRVIHRVTAIDVKNASVMIQGDNNRTADGWQDYSNVQSIVAAVWYTNAPSPVLPS